jgi:hypothetical protein
LLAAAVRAADRGRDGRLEDEAAPAAVKSLVLRPTGLASPAKLGVHIDRADELVRVAAGTAAPEASCASVESNLHGHR